MRFCAGSWSQNFEYTELTASVRGSSRSIRPQAQAQSTIASPSTMVVVREPSVAGLIAFRASAALLCDSAICLHRRNPGRSEYIVISGTLRSKKRPAAAPALQAMQDRRSGFYLVERFSISSASSPTFFAPSTSPTRKRMPKACSMARTSET